MTDETVTRSEFARLQGWSPSYVTKLVGQERLVLTADGKRVRVAESLARLAATKDPARQDVEDRWAAQRAGADEAPADEAPADEPAPPADTVIEHNYQTARARREYYAAQTAQIEYEKQLGNLVEVTAIRAAAAETGAQIRTLLENLPAQLAPELAAESDEARVQALLVERVEILLNNIAELIERAAG